MTTTTPEFKDNLPQKLLKYCGRIGMVAASIDVVQSFFTGETYGHYVWELNYFDSYCADVLYFGHCVIAELAYRRSVRECIEREEKFRKTMEALEKTRQSPLEDLVNEEK